MKITATKEEKYIIGVVLALILIISVLIFARNLNKEDNPKQEINNQVPTEEVTELKNFLNAIAGVKAESLEIINTPVIGVKGELVAPEESIKSGIDYFLEKTENTKMKDLTIDIVDNNISITVDYKVLGNLTTPVKVVVTPTLNESEDLLIKIKEVRLIDLKVPTFIVNFVLDNFVVDWFPANEKVKVDIADGQVTVYKENFKGVNLKNISISDDKVSIEVIIEANF